MTVLRIVNLLDDFGLGGVTKGLSVYDDPAFAGVISATTLAIPADQIVAPRIAADIIITHTPPSWRRIAFLASLRARNRHAKILHVEHSYSPQWAELHVAHPRRFALMLRLAFGLVDHVVAVSHAVGDWMQRIGAVDAHRLSVIYPYSGKKGLDRVPDMRLPIVAPLTIGAYGRFCEAKGFDTLVAAMRLLERDHAINLLLGGFGPDQAQLVELAGLARNIRFTGRVDDVADFLGQCHVCVIPSRYEAYGQVANEAREAGRPILVSHAGGLPEQVGRAGIVADCRTPASLAAAIAALSSHPLEAMGRAGRAATSGCGEQRIAQWITLFRQMTASKASRVAPFTPHNYARSG